MSFKAWQKGVVVIEPVNELVDRLSDDWEIPLYEDWLSAEFQASVGCKVVDDIIEGLIHG